MSGNILPNRVSDEREGDSAPRHQPAIMHVSPKVPVGHQTACNGCTPVVPESNQPESLLAPSLPHPPRGEPRRASGHPSPNGLGIERVQLPYRGSSGPGRAAVSPASLWPARSPGPQAAAGLAEGSGATHDGAGGKRRPQGGGAPEEASGLGEAGDAASADRGQGAHLPPSASRLGTGPGRGVGLSSGPVSGLPPLGRGPRRPTAGLPRPAEAGRKEHRGQQPRRRSGPGPSCRAEGGRRPQRRGAWTRGGGRRGAIGELREPEEPQPTGHASGAPASPCAAKR